MMMSQFENSLVGREIGSPGEDRPKLLKLLPGNKCGPGQLFTGVNKEIRPRMIQMYHNPQNWT
jgi:hypothetical protein